MSGFFFWFGSFDLAAAFLLAAAASCRARLFGGHVSGAAVLGCLCGLAGPLLRECLGGGSGAELLASGAFLGAVVAGALAGAGLAGLRRQGAGLFFWLDSLGLALAACLGAMRGLTLGLGAAGALVLGLLAGLVPGLLRDMALGDTARAVEESWYATAAALGGMLTIGLARLPWRPSGWAPSGAQWEYACIACGVLLAAALRFWRGRRNPD